MDIKRYTELLNAFGRKRVLVVGDVFLDENVHGRVTEVSLEAPIPVFEVQERRYNPGAAGNAACNLAALGAKTSIVGVVGDDINAGIVRREFEARGVDPSGLVTDSDSPTNTYGKLRAGGFNIPEQEILRTDTPTPGVIEGKLEDKVIAAIEERASQVDAIVVTDQVASVVTDRVIEIIAELGKRHNLVTVADSRNRIGDFRGFKIVVPNDREAGVGLGFDVIDMDSLERAAKALVSVAEMAYITRGPDGISVVYPDGTIHTEHHLANNVVDVTGAGDTVTATITLATLAGASPVEAAVLGNAAAAVAVAQQGAVTVKPYEVEEVLLSEGGPMKVRTLEDLEGIVKSLQEEGNRIVWTNGCFDILHVGHISYLVKAARQGDILIVGLNNDESVRKVKGPDRPIVPENERAMVLSALECVDYVTIFAEESPERILETLKPDVYTKGGDYTIDTINQDERRIVEGYGGRIAIIQGVDGKSTTKLVEHILREDRVRREQ